MSWADSSATLAEELSESQWSALLKLLADEDPAIARTVREKIISYGPAAAERLRSCLLSDDPALRRQTQGIVLHFDRHAADDRFVEFCLKNGEDLDLEQGAFLLAQTQYPRINVQGYQALLDAFAEEVKAVIQPGATPKEILALLNEYLFDELGFVGNKETYYDPENSYLNRVVDRRTGNPINLCVFYLLMARRLRLPVTGIGLPGHFICRYQSSSGDIYIDAFNQGKLLTKADCIQYLLQGNYSLRDDYLAPVSTRRMLLRICGNLHQIYLHLEREEQTTRLQRYLVALSR